MSEISNTRFCKDCVHCQIIAASWSEEDQQYLCDYHRDNVTGLAIPCRIARDNENLCGELGRKFLNKRIKRHLLK